VKAGFSGTRGKISYWFGEVDNTQPDPAKQLDFSAAFLAPYMETNQAAFQCPDLSLKQVDAARFGKMACSFAYNGHYLGRGIDYDYSTWPPGISQSPRFRRLRDVPSTSATIAFADSAQVKCLNWPSCTSTSLEEVWLIEPPKNEFPTVHFRHAMTANVAFLDGHVESMEVRWIDHSLLPAGQAARIRNEGLGHIGLDETLYDLE